MSEANCVAQEGPQKPAVEDTTFPVLWVLGGPKMPEKLALDGSKWEPVKLSSYFQPIGPSGPKGGLWVHHQEKIARWYVDSNLTRDQSSVEPARDLFAHALLGLNMYIMGGEKLGITGGERRRRAAVRDCLVYEYTTRVWSRAPNLPRETSGRTAVVIQGKIYLTSGRNDEAAGQMDIFDPKVNLEWRTCECQMSTPRYGHATAASDKHVWIFGGRTQDGKLLSDVERFDVVTERWQSMRPIITPRINLSATLYKGCFYLIGGKQHKPTSSSEGQTGLEICGTVDIYDPSTEQCSPGPSLQYSRAGHGSVVLWMKAKQGQQSIQNRT